MFQPRPNMSNVWAGISYESNNIGRGTSISIGNGRSTLFWDHPWIDGTILANKALADIPSELIGATVSDMWDGSEGWKWDTFANFLPQTELLKIAAYSIIPDTELEDTVYWRGSSSGKFTIKSALGFLKGQNPSDIPELPIWRIIWRLPVQQRVRMFLWIAAHDRLMTNVNRVH